MGEREQAADLDGNDDGFEPLVGDYDNDDFEPLEAFSSQKQRLAALPIFWSPTSVKPLEAFSSQKQRLAAMRRRAERRLEEKRLREELGDYDLELDDY